MKPDETGGVDPTILEIGDTCLLMRTRLISRVFTSLYDEALQPHGIGAAQFVLLVVIDKLEPASRADLGRFHRQDRSTLSRNLKVIIAEGWAEEAVSLSRGRVRPIVLTKAGRDLLVEVAQAWRSAQARARALLGPTGTDSVTTIADAMLNRPPEP